MQILHKHITQSGGLSFIWEDHNGYQVAGFDRTEVMKFLRDNIIVKDEGDTVWIRRRNAYGMVDRVQKTYEECLSQQIARPRFCEQIITSNTLTK